MLIAQEASIRKRLGRAVFLGRRVARADPGEAERRQVDDDVPLFCRFVGGKDGLDRERNMGERRRFESNAAGKAARVGHEITLLSRTRLSRQATRKALSGGIESRVELVVEPIFV